MTVGMCCAATWGFGRRHAGECTSMADSHRNRSEWLRVDRLPAFGEPPTVEECTIVLGDLEVETLRCMRTTSDGTPEAVNILHASPDIGRVDAEIACIADFMKTRGFTVERKIWFNDWVDTDVLIFGLDESHMSRVDRALGILIRGAGLVRGWNVLLYGLDGRPQLEPDPFENPLLTDQNFGFDAICMLHAHMRLRNNTQFWTGYLVYMVDLVEYGITLLIENSPHGKPANDERNLYRRINILAGELREAGVKKADVELFTHAAHLTRVVRNAYVHEMAGKPLEQRIRELYSHMDEFYDVTERHARGDLLLGARDLDTGDVGAFNMFTPFFVRLTLILDRWLRDCLGRCAPLPTEHLDGSDKRHVP